MGQQELRGREECCLSSPNEGAGWTPLSLFFLGVVISPLLYFNLLCSSVTDGQPSSINSRRLNYCASCVLTSSIPPCLPALSTRDRNGVFSAFRSTSSGSNDFAPSSCSISLPFSRSSATFVTSTLLEISLRAGRSHDEHYGSNEADDEHAVAPNWIRRSERFFAGSRGKTHR